MSQGKAGQAEHYMQAGLGLARGELTIWGHSMGPSARRVFRTRRKFIAEEAPVR